MRINRFKKTHRAIGFYEKNYGFRKPFQVLVDGTLAQAALLTKVNLREQLPKYVDGQIKLLTTPCILMETEAIGPQLRGALEILKQYIVHKCPHVEERIGSSACIHSMLKAQAPGGNDNPNRYIVATQDPTLRHQLRQIPGVPLLYLHGNAPTLEKPSRTSMASAQNLNRQRTQVAPYQKDTLAQMKKEVFGESSSNPKPRKRKAKGGPNPLSCKKAKKQLKTGHPPSSTKQPDQQVSSSIVQNQKPKRLKLKIPKHVKSELTKRKAT